MDDLAELELCYAPPVGSAKDPVNMAGMAAQNIIDGLVSIVDWKDLESCCQEEGVVVLDVRGTGEIENSGELVPALLISLSLNDLRGRINEVPRDAKKIIVSCASGQRAYYACRILVLERI